MDRLQAERAIGPGATGKATTNVSALVDKGNALFVQGNYRQTIQYYDKALAMDPNNKYVLNNKGNALFVQGNYRQAIQYYDKAFSSGSKFYNSID